jgi:hypothetical protein
MTDFSFDDDPFKDDDGSDPFARGSDPFGSGDSSLGGHDDLSMGEDDLTGSPFLDPNADLPADLVMPPPPNSPRNRPFIIGLVILAVVLVIGLALIVIAAIAGGSSSGPFHATETAIAIHNSGVLTQVAGTATAKSYSPTPSLTWTPSVTPTLTPSNTPTVTLSPTLTPSNTPVPGITASVTLTPSLTATVSNTPAPITPPDNNAVNTQAAALQAAQQIISAQETLNAHAPGDKPATQQYKKTQAAEFDAAQTAIAARLTANAQNAQNAQVAPPVTVTATPGTAGDTSSSVTLTPSPTNAAPAGIVTGGDQATSATSIVTIDPGNATATPVGSSRLIDPNRAMVRYMRPVLADGPTAIPLVATPTGSNQQLAGTATAQFINDDTQQVIAVQTALLAQLTMNAMVTPVTTAVQTENAQLQLGLTAVSIQLTANAQALAGLATPSMPATGLYEDLAGGKVNPASLMLIGALAIGLVGVIVAARRLRTH